MSKEARTQTNISKDMTSTLCPQFNITALSDISQALLSLQSPIITQISVDRYTPSGSGLLNTAYFKRVVGEEAFDFVNSFQAFETRCSGLRGGMSEESVLCAITSITGLFWQNLSKHVADLKPTLTYNYNMRDETGATKDNKRPDETIFMDDFLACKGEHKRTDQELSKAIKEQSDKLAGYNHVEYGPRIKFLPVYSAAGVTVAWGFVDVRTKVYYEAARHDLTDNDGRCACFVSAINCFRYLRTMAPYIPRNPSPVFKEQTGLTFYDKYVLKKVPENCSCPAALYDLLGTGSVPCAAKVERRNKNIKVSPVGVRTPDRGEDLSVAEVRTAVRAVLTCLAYLHPRNFVHRDIRWANLIRTYTARADGTIDSVNFLVIDFEFSGVLGEPMLIQDYIFRDTVPYGEAYLAHHDLFFVGKLIRTWAECNGIELDAQALSLVQMLQSGHVDVETLLAHEWLA